MVLQRTLGAEQNVPEKKRGRKERVGRVYEQDLQDSGPGTEGRHLLKLRNVYAGLSKAARRVWPATHLLREPRFLPQCVRRL